jgi:hypothetical protein
MKFGLGLREASQGLLEPVAPLGRSTIFGQC